jgi:hypothetical protein
MNNLSNMTATQWSEMCKGLDSYSIAFLQRELNEGCSLTRAENGVRIGGGQHAKRGVYRFLFLDGRVTEPFLSEAKYAGVKSAPGIDHAAELASVLRASLFCIGGLGGITIKAKAALINYEDSLK